MIRSLQYMFLTTAFLASTALASEPTAKEAIALVESGAAFMKANGKDELIGRVNAKDPAFVQGALYMTVRDINNGVILANPVNPAIIGKDLLDVSDSEGKFFRREILELAKTKGKGWVDYRFQNPTTKKVESKTSYRGRHSGGRHLQAVDILPPPPPAHGEYVPCGQALRYCWHELARFSEPANQHDLFLPVFVSRA